MIFFNNTENFLMLFGSSRQTVLAENSFFNKALGRKSSSVRNILLTSSLYCNVSKTSLYLKFGSFVVSGYGEGIPFNFSVLIQGFL